MSGYFGSSEWQVWGCFCCDINTVLEKAARQTRLNHQKVNNGYVHSGFGGAPARLGGMWGRIGYPTASNNTSVVSLFFHTDPTTGPLKSPWHAWYYRGYIPLCRSCRRQITTSRTTTTQALLLRQRFPFQLADSAPLEHSVSGLIQQYPSLLQRQHQQERDNNT